jgi:hypothetical protein
MNEIEAPHHEPRAIENDLHVQTRRRRGWGAQDDDAQSHLARACMFVATHCGGAVQHARRMPRTYD